MNAQVLDDYAGRYRSNELGVDWRFALAEGALRLDARHLDGRLVPIAPDAFSLSETGVRFDETAQIRSRRREVG